MFNKSKFWSEKKKPNIGKKVLPEIVEEKRANQAKNTPNGQGRWKKALETRKPLVCYNCRERGSLAATCSKPKVALHYADADDEGLTLLE